MRAAVNTQRWWIRAPVAGESLRSVLCRAAALYKCSPRNLWYELNDSDTRPAGDVDSPSCFALRRMAAALGIPASQLFAHRQQDTPWLLAPNARDVYCPICWNEDLARGDPNSIRCDWSRLLRTTCLLHNCPLRLAPENWFTSSLGSTLQMPQFSELEKRILYLVESFGQALERSLMSGDAWPSHWRGNPPLARQLLLTVSFNVNEIRDIPLSGYVMANGNLAEVIRGPRRLQEPARKLRWDVFRSISDPALRRAALWSAAWSLARDRPIELSPGWFTLPSHIKARFPAI